MGGPPGQNSRTRQDDANGVGGGGHLSNGNSNSGQANDFSGAMGPKEDDDIQRHYADIMQKYEAQ